MTNRRATLWFALFAVVVFASGVATGVLADRLLDPARPPFAIGAFRGGPSPARLSGRLAKELALTAEQREKVRAIFERRRGDVRRMRSDARRRFVEEQDSFRAEIREVLTPEQQQKFDRMLQRGPEGVWPGAGRFLLPPPPDPPEP